MELVDLEIGLLKYLSSQGYTLNVHEIIGLNAGAGKLQWQEKFNNNEIFFWGKINAVQGAYYIVYGLRNEVGEFASKKFYYSGEDFEFAELSPVTEDEELEIISEERNTPFSGNPEKVLGAPAAEEEGAEGEEKPTVTELMRLAQTVSEIDLDSAVVPKGSHSLNDDQKVVTAPDFSGLSEIDALKLDNYVHLRPPTSLDKLRVMVRDDAEWKMTGFLDSLAQDQPKGAWAIRDEGYGANVHLRSLVWPGYAAFHVPRSKYYGGIYIGMGIKNHDLPFLL